VQALRCRQVEALPQPSLNGPTWRIYQALKRGVAITATPLDCLGSASSRSCWISASVRVAGSLAVVREDQISRAGSSLIHPESTQNPKNDRMVGCDRGRSGALRRISPAEASPASP